MIDVARKILLHDKLRFAITVSGVAFAVSLVFIQVGLFLGLLDNASVTIDKTNADLWVTSRNTANIDYGQAFPANYVQRVRSVPGVERADNLIVWFVRLTLPSGSTELVIAYAMEDFTRWNLPWNVSEGNIQDMRRGNYVFLDDSVTKRYGNFSTGDYREFLGRRMKTREVQSFTTTPVAFMGSGKTTLLSILGCILTPTSGDVFIEGRRVAATDMNGLAAMRKKSIGFVFQQFNLFGALTAQENIEYALNLKGVRGKSARKEAARLVELVGLSDRRHFLPRDLSGGQKQRVAIARALVGTSPIILADEPTANLDFHAGQQVLELFRQLAKQENRALLIVTHDPRVRAITDRTVLIRDGVLYSEQEALA